MPISPPTFHRMVSCSPRSAVTPSPIFLARATRWALASSATNPPPSVARCLRILTAMAPTIRAPIRRCPASQLDCTSTSIPTGFTKAERTHFRPRPPRLRMAPTYSARCLLEAICRQSIRRMRTFRATWSHESPLSRKLLLPMRTTSRLISPLWECSRRRWTRPTLPPEIRSPTPFGQPIR